MLWKFSLQKNFSFSLSFYVVSLYVGKTIEIRKNIPFKIPTRCNFWSIETLNKTFRLLLLSEKVVTNKKNK